MSRIISHVPRLPILAAGIAAGGTVTETDVLLEQVLASLDSPQTYTDPRRVGRGFCGPASSYSSLGSLLYRIPWAGIWPLHESSSPWSDSS